MITAVSFPTPHLALRTNDPAAQARVGSFADLQAAAAEDVRRRLWDADLPNRPFHEVLGELRTSWDALTQWRYQLALAAPGRLGVGIPLDADRFLLPIRDGGVNYDRLGYTGRMRCGATWDPDTRTYQGGEETPASAIIARYGQLAHARFDADAPHDDELANSVRTFDGRTFTGNRLARRAAAATIAEKLKARVAARGCDTATFETGADPIYAVTADPAAADALHGIAHVQLAGAFDLTLRDERITAWQAARYLLYQSPRTKKGSDAVTRVFLVAVGAVLFGQPPVMEQDADLRCMVLGQDAATEMPADEVLWP